MPLCLHRPDRLATALGALLMVLAPAVPAMAQSPRQAMFPSDATCYLRQYSRDHLAGHPDQMVTQIAVGPDQGNWESDVLVLRVALYLRGSNERHMGHAYCENTGGALSCGLGGDGGWFTLQPARKGGLLMTVGRDPLGFEGARGFVSIGGPASDDDSFLIPPVPADACP